MLWLSLLVVVVLFHSNPVLPVALDNGHGPLRRANGSVVFGWGRNDQQQLGMNTLTNNSESIPSVVGTYYEIITNVTSGHNFNLAQTATNYILGWGQNDLGQLGIGDTTWYIEPQLIHYTSGIKQKFLKAGQNHAILGIDNQDSSPGFDFDDLGKPDLKVAGDARVNEFGVVSLTADPPKKHSVGSLWYAQKVQIYQAFEMQFRFVITNSDKYFGGGDGFAVVFQNYNATYTGGDGQNLGLAKGSRSSFQLGMPNTIGIEFITFNTGQVQVRSCGSNPYTYDDTAGKCSFGKTVLTQNIKDGVERTVIIDYAPYVLSVYLDDTSAPILRIPFNVESLIKTNNTDGLAYVGFTSSTGDAFAVHKIIAWHFKNLAIHRDATAGMSGANQVRSWGGGQQGQLGLQDWNDKHEPNLMTSLANFVIQRVAAGALHSVAVTDDANVYTWGGNQMGQLGHVNTDPLNIPTKVRAILLLTTTYSPGGCLSPDLRLMQSSYGCTVDVAAGGYFTFFVFEIKKAGTLWHEIFGTGDNTFGQLGCVNSVDDADNNIYCPFESPSVRMITQPQRLAAFTDTQKIQIAAVHAGMFHSMFLTADMRVMTMGLNSAGQLGTGDLTNRQVPTVISAAFDFPRHSVFKIAVGGFHNLLLRDDHVVYAWGANYFGQLGLGDRISRATPQVIPFFQGTTSQVDRPLLDISAGKFHSVGFTACKGGGFESGYSCNCRFGWKGPDCSIKCLGSVPCSGHGTFDSENRRGTSRDDQYDCENDGTCICLSGFVADDCSIECKPTPSRHFVDPLGQRGTCICKPGYTGLACDISLTTGSSDGNVASSTCIPNWWLLILSLTFLIIYTHK